MLSLAVLVSLAVASNAVRTFVVRNDCAYTIWPATFTDLTVGSAIPDYVTGWEAAPNTQVSFTVPDNWKAGRIWARRVCDFSDPAPATQCVDGGCNGGLECDPHDGSGVPPASLAEFTLSGDGDQDYYDVSLVDGFNLPVRIDNDAQCPIPKCLVDLNPDCPAPLRVIDSSTNTTAGCFSACKANLDGHNTNSPNCCNGQYGTPETCPVSGVQYYSYFKDSCPDSYAYAYDEASGRSLWTCHSELHANYTITFCPSSA